MQCAGLEYDLDLFNIVAVDDFNMGAMENKSLNIFNSRLVSPPQASDLICKASAPCWRAGHCEAIPQILAKAMMIRVESPCECSRCLCLGWTHPPMKQRALLLFGVEA